MARDYVPMSIKAGFTRKFMWNACQEDEQLK